MAETFRRITRSGLSRRADARRGQSAGRPRARPPGVRSPKAAHDDRRESRRAGADGAVRRGQARQPRHQPLVLQARARLLTPAGPALPRPLRRGLAVHGQRRFLRRARFGNRSPIGAFQLHASYTFRPRLWLAADATYYTGGRSTLDGVENDDGLRNSRFGLTAAFPLGRRQSLKVAWASGVSTRIGGDFDSVTVAWQILWFDRAK